MYLDTGSRTPACQRLFSRHVCTKEAGCVPYTMSDVLLRLVQVYVHINLNVLYFVQHKISLEELISLPRENIRNVLKKLTLKFSFKSDQTTF
jgi:hypothetical protein